MSNYDQTGCFFVPLLPDWMNAQKQAFLLKCSVSVVLASHRIPCCLFIRNTIVQPSLMISTISEWSNRTSFKHNRQSRGQTEL